MEITEQTIEELQKALDEARATRERIEQLDPQLVEKVRKKLYPASSVKEKSTKYFIYVLVDPKEPKCVRYVGNTRVWKERLAYHLKELPTGTSRKHQWLRDVVDNGRMPELRIIMVALTKESGYELEKQCIRMYRLLKHDLTNSTDGGDGRLNPIPEVRKRISDISKALWKDPAYINKIRISMNSDGYKDKQRKKQIALWQDPVYRKRITELSRKVVETRLRRLG